MTKLEKRAVAWIRRRDGDGAADEFAKAFQEGRMSVTKDGSEFLFSLTDVGRASVEAMGAVKQ